jgi:hypothetical protein
MAATLVDDRFSLLVDAVVSMGTQVALEQASLQSRGYMNVHAVPSSQFGHTSVFDVSQALHSSPRVKRMRGTGAGGNVESMADVMLRDEALS